MSPPSRRPLGLAVAGIAAVTWLLAAPAAVAEPKAPGLIDGSVFIDIAGEEALTVEISLHRSLLRLLSAVDEELAEATGGLDSIHAVVLELSEPEVRGRVRDEMTRMDRRLRQKGWERIATVREGDSRLSVLILNDEETIRGLVVMVVDEQEVVFANVSGLINLAKMKRLGEQLDLPGLDEIDTD